MSQVLKLISIMLIEIVLVAPTCSNDEKSRDDTTLLEQVDPRRKYFIGVGRPAPKLDQRILRRSRFSGDFSDECKILDDDTDTD